MQCTRLREPWLRRNHELFGHRWLMDTLVPGGVAVDLDGAGIARLRADQAALRRALVPLFAVLDHHPSLTDRLVGTGRLSTEQARALGCTGYVGKASGLTFDVRQACPYPPYDRLTTRVPAETTGDVEARMRVRMAEILASLDLLDQLLADLPEGPSREHWPPPCAATSGVGVVESWRGETLAFVRCDAEGRVARYFPRDPSWFTWPALEQLIHGNIVPDFPVCNKSVNGSYAGVDL